MLVMSQRGDTVTAEGEAADFCVCLEDEARDVWEPPLLMGVGLLICALLQDSNTLVC